MTGRKAARNMQSRNTNKIGIQCICWFYSQGIRYDARSYDLKISNTLLDKLHRSGDYLFRDIILLFARNHLGVGDKK